MERKKKQKEALTKEQFLFHKVTHFDPVWWRNFECWDLGHTSVIYDIKGSAKVPVKTTLCPAAQFWTKSSQCSQETDSWNFGRCGSTLMSCSILSLKLLVNLINLRASTRTLKTIHSLNQEVRRSRSGQGRAAVTTDNPIIFIWWCWLIRYCFI